MPLNKEKQEQLAAHYATLGNHQEVISRMRLKGKKWDDVVSIACTKKIPLALFHAQWRKQNEG